MPYFGQELFAAGARRRDRSPSRRTPTRWPATTRFAGEEGLDAVLGEHQLDALVAPTGGPAWITDLVNGDHYLRRRARRSAAVAGYPNVTVPAGYVFGLPVGISFIGGRGPSRRSCGWPTPSSRRPGPG